jgi:hypothetical protein
MIFTCARSLDNTSIEGFSLQQRMENEGHSLHSIGQLLLARRYPFYILVLGGRNTDAVISVDCKEVARGVNLEEFRAKK